MPRSLARPKAGNRRRLWMLLALPAAAATAALVVGCSSSGTGTEAGIEQNGLTR